MEEVLRSEVWKARSWDHYNFMRGQWDVIARFSVEQMKMEIARMKETLRDEMEHEG